MPGHRFLPPDPRPSKAHPEHRRRRKELEKEHGYEWVPPIILGLLGITLAFDVTKDVAKAEEKKLKERWDGGEEGSHKDDERKSKGRSKSRKGDTGDGRERGREGGRDRDRDRGESRRSERRRSRKPWDIDENDDGDGSASEERGQDGRRRRRRSRRWEVYEPDEVPDELAAAVGATERDGDGGWARQREAEAWRRADLMERGQGTVAAAAAAATERGRRSSLDRDEGHYSRGGRRGYRDAGYDYGYGGSEDQVGDYDRGFHAREGEAAVEERRMRPRQRRRSSDW